MTTKHQPATPLPWNRAECHLFVEAGAHRIARVQEGGAETVSSDTQNANYIAHAANAYPRLVEALRWIAHTAPQAYHSHGVATVANEQERAAKTLLRELGED